MKCGTEKEREGVTEKERGDGDRGDGDRGAQQEGALAALAGLQPAQNQPRPLLAAGLEDCRSRSCSISFRSSPPMVLGILTCRQQNGAE